MFNRRGATTSVLLGFVTVALGGPIATADELPDVLITVTDENHNVLAPGAELTVGDQITMTVSLNAPVTGEQLSLSFLRARRDGSEGFRDWNCEALLDPAPEFGADPLSCRDGSNGVAYRANSILGPREFAGEVFKATVTLDEVGEWVVFLERALIDTTDLSLEWTTGDAFGFSVVDDVPQGPTAISDCLGGGWVTYTQPSFPNQGRCVAATRRP